ncbi:MAG: IS1 family transposase [Erysipelotrichaceae bacterium]|nr:IS1 family transposase [Erysipelotrichaceae bacterium]
MSNRFTDSVFALSKEDFILLEEAVSLRRNKDRYGVYDFDGLSDLYKRIPSCPRCGSKDYVFNGFTPDGKNRYLCRDCNHRFTILSNTIFHSTKKSFDTWCTYLVLMSFNVPLEMTQEICYISHPTAMLWRKKVFATVDGYQDRLYLKDRVWIDEL